jgi:phosphatidylglycerol---prolipoprotein diacylglyceryl transferase
MHPILVQLGPISIRYYGLMYIIAIALGFYLLWREVRRKKIPLTMESLLDLLLLTIPLALIGARLYYVVFRLDYYGRYPLDIFKIWEGGLAIHGGVLGGILAVLIFTRWKKVKFWSLTDAMAPSLILGQAIGRIGNLMNGDAYGIPTNLPWGIHFPPDSPAGMAYPGLATHPSMIYEMILNLGIFAYLWAIRKKGYKDGFATSMYFILYAVARSIVSMTRGDDLYLGPIRLPYLVSALLLIGFGLFIWRARLYRKTQMV